MAYFNVVISEMFSVNRVVSCMKNLWIKAKALITKIGLVDRFLILFMLILLLYTAIGLFIGITDSQSGDMVDTIIRTSSAAIFGYFISANFTKINTTNSPADSYRRNLSIPVHVNDESSNVPISNQDEFAASSDVAEEQEKTSVTEFSSDQISCSRLQVIIVSSIGGCALILLFITKLFIAETSEISVTVSQLRDFVSASIGFLISCGRVK